MLDDGDTPVLSPEAQQRRDDAKSAMLEAEAGLLELTTTVDTSVDAQRAQAEQSRRVWELRSIYYAACGHVDHATKASKAAVEQGKLAVSLGKSTLLDRVAACELALKEATRSGSKIRAAAARRRR